MGNVPGGTEATSDLPPVDSVPRRFAVTLAANVVKLAVGVATASIVPRSLGPRDYGSFQFLIAAAGTFRTFLDFGASTAAYTFNAKHRRNGLAALLYARWLLIQLAVILVLVVLAGRLGLAPRIWPGQPLRYVLLIGGLEWLTFAGNFLLQLGDAKAETVRVQRISLVTQAVRLGLLLALFALGVLNLGSFVLASFIVSALTAAAVAGTFVIPKRHQYFRLDLPEPDRRATVAFFVSYGRPLALLGLAVFIHDFFDRWLLQATSGSVQQGYFSLGSQWSGIALLFTTSALNIVWREVSHASGTGDRARMGSIFQKSTRTFFLVASVVAFLVALNTGALVHGLAGSQYAGAQIVTALLAFYPVHQTLGQINGVFFFATERVGLYRNVTVVALAGGAMMSYLLVGPAHAPVPGLELGALGLALKQVLVNIVSVTVLHSINARFTGLSPLREIGVQVQALAVVGACSGVAFLVAGQLGIGLVLVRMAIMGMLQAGLLAGAVYWFPHLAGLTRDELRAYASRGAAWLRSR